ncbi:MAG: DUF4390 domain-containing protein [Caldimonas sp.]
MTPTPPHGSLRRRSVLRSLGLAASRLLAPGAWAGVLAAGAGPARAADAELTVFDVSRDDEGVFLSYAVEFALGKGPEDALVRAVPLFFVAEAEVFRERWYWRDRRVGHATRVWKIVFQPLTSTYRVTTMGGLSQNYATRDEAIAALSRSGRWKVAEAGQVDDGRHYLEFSYRLDVALLPRPMQIGIGGQPDWQLAVRRAQRIQ